MEFFRCERRQGFLPCTRSKHLLALVLAGEHTFRRTSLLSLKSFSAMALHNQDVYQAKDTSRVVCT